MKTCKGIKEISYLDNKNHNLRKNRKIEETQFEILVFIIPHGSAGWSGRSAAPQLCRLIQPCSLKDQLCSAKVAEISEPFSQSFMPGLFKAW